MSRHRTCSSGLNNESVKIEGNHLEFFVIGLFAQRYESLTEFWNIWGRDLSLKFRDLACASKNTSEEPDGSFQRRKRFIFL